MNILEALISLLLFSIGLFGFLNTQQHVLTIQHQNQQDYVKQIEQHNARQ